MRADQIEQERKYQGGPLPQHLDRVPGVARVLPADPQELDAVYYDTADHALLRRGITLRRRTGDQDEGWHLKLPRGPDTREEIHAADPDGTAQDGAAPGGAAPNGADPDAGVPGAKVPEELALRVAVFARGHALRPVVRMHTHRRRHHLLDDGGHVLAEITEDAVEARVPGPVDHPGGGNGPPDGSGHGTPATAAWNEIEIELGDGDTALLDHVDEVFTGGGLARSPHPSKLARALGELGRTDTPGGPPDPPPVRLPAGTPAAVVAARIRDLVDTLVDLDPRVRLDEPDAVHRMRVTARRLRSVLTAHRRLLDRGRSDPLAGELRLLGRTLGRARDQEVLGERLVAALDRLPGPLRGGALRGRITAHYARQYHRAWQQVLAELDGPRHHRLLDEAERFAADPPFTAAARRKKASAYFSRTLRREQRRVVRRLDPALRLDPGPERDAALHRARKAAKRARYAAESARPVAPKRAKKFVRRMKDLQQALGDRQDTAVARAALVDLGSGGDDGFALGVLYGLQQGDAAEAERRVPALLRRARRRGLARLTRR
ncbi:CHAD domain-containing protein [Kitasatospora sp. NE20-6]|uniref:CYTH and CHAD domain-containing protein n=1 Tax=Kitasatospora sp. NE20-6 TaxID=2859066 RepID=UPI0034DBF181